MDCFDDTPVRTSPKETECPASNSSPGYFSCFQAYGTNVLRISVRDGFCRSLAPLQAPYFIVIVEVDFSWYVTKISVYFVSKRADTFYSRVWTPTSCTKIIFMSRKNTFPHDIHRLQIPYERMLTEDAFVQSKLHLEWPPEIVTTTAAVILEAFIFARTGIQCQSSTSVRIQWALPLCFPNHHTDHQFCWFHYIRPFILKIFMKFLLPCN